MNYKDRFDEKFFEKAEELKAKEYVEVLSYNDAKEQVEMVQLSNGDTVKTYINGKLIAEVPMIYFNA